MQALDLRSLVIMAGLMGAVMGLLLLAMRRDFPPSIRGMLPWGLAPLSAAASTVLFGFPHLLPDALTATVGNSLLMTSAGLYYFGSQRFYGQPSTWRRWAGFGLAVTAVITLFLVVWPDYRLRVLLFCLAVSAVVVAHAWLLWRMGHGFGARFTATVLTLFTLVLLARGCSTLWLDTPDATRLTPSPMQMLYLVANSFTVLFVSLGHVLMASERVRQEFQHLATHDSLTGALTRRATLLALGHEAERWQRYGQPFAVLMLDIDHFKHVNDTYGHQAGDRVLMEVVTLASQSLRATDHLGRHGGEEFLAVLPETRLAAAIQVAERIRHAVDARAGTPERPSCSVSVGVAAMADGETVEGLLARVDAALYRAKAAGRNRVIWDGREAAENAPQPETSAV